jgi:alanyl-tRNA synthetase
MDPAVRLYLEDPRRVEFDAEIRARVDVPGGVGVVLDRTAFYPTSGGQPHDTGTLDGIAVTEVFETEDGTIVHRVDTAPIGPRVHGRIDAVRRRDHMQQHSGQHLLSATVLALQGRDTLSFHLGRERCSIDLPGAALDDAALQDIEMRCNEIVWEARPVRARFLDAGEAAALRKALPAGTGTVRVVEIEGWDQNACCGTHVAHTSEIGLVKFLAQERVKPGTRLHFACGARALQECGQALRRVDRLAAALTCHPDAVAEKIEALQRDAKTMRKTADVLRHRVAEYEARGWIGAAPRFGGVAVVVHETAEADLDALRVWADALVEAGAVALLGARRPRAQLLFARPDGVGLDLRPVLQAACDPIGGKGGGPPERVQGAGAHADGIPIALAAARTLVERVLAPDAT